jgi:hypothetical protein
MSNSANNYGKKGWCFGYFLIFIVLFIMLVVYVYNGNQNSLPLTK